MKIYFCPFQPVLLKTFRHKFLDMADHLIEVILAQVTQFLKKSFLFFIDSGGIFSFREIDDLKGCFEDWLVGAASDSGYFQMREVIFDHFPKIELKFIRYLVDILHKNPPTLLFGLYNLQLSQIICTSFSTDSTVLYFFYLNLLVTVPKSIGFFITSG